MRYAHCLFSTLQILWLVSLALGQTPPSPPLSTESPCPTVVSETLKRTGRETSASVQRILEIEKPSTVAKSAPTEGNKVRIEIYGLTAFSYCEALQFLRSAPVVPTEMPNSKDAENAASLLKERLQSIGYMRAAVDAVRDEEARRVLLVVNEGERFLVAGVRFEGNRIFTTEELTQNYHACWATFQKTSRKEYDADLHMSCVRSLTNMMRNQGYLEAKLESEKEVTDRVIAIKLKIDEGVLYRLGQITLKGNEALTQQQVKSTLELREGEIVHGDKLSKWLFEDVKRMYGELGFIEYTAEPIPSFNKQSGIVNLVVEIDEGNRFTLRSIEFVGHGLNALNPHDLFLLREGDFYNQSLYEESIKRLNDTGWFEFIDQDKDVERWTDNEESTLKVVVKLRSKTK